MSEFIGRQRFHDCSLSGLVRHSALRLIPQSNRHIPAAATHSLRQIIPLSHRRLHIRQQMDWKGQKLAEQMMQIMLVASAVVAFSTGYTMGSFRLMILVYAAGVVLTTLITVPNWPFFNRHPLEWLDPSEAEKHPKPQPPVVLKKKPTKK